MKNQLVNIIWISYDGEGQMIIIKNYENPN
jgi:hypothetical protein